MPVTQIPTSAASNPTVISDLDNSGAWDGLLKDIYLPGLTDTLFNDKSFTALITTGSEQIDYSGNRIIRTFKTQRAGGVGPMAEGGSFVPSVPMKGQQFYEQVKYLNAYLELTGPSIQAAKAGAGSFVDLVTDSFEDTITNAQNDFECQLTGEANGNLAYIVNGSATPTGVPAATNFDCIGQAFFDTQFFTPGMQIEFRDYAPGTAGSSDGTSTLETSVQSSDNYATVASTTQGNKDVNNRSYGNVICENTLSSKGLAGTYMHAVRRNSYGYSSTESGSTTDYLGINGLQNLVDDGNTSGWARYGIWNCVGVKGERNTLSYLQSMVKDASSGDVYLSEETLLQYIMEMRYARGAKPDILVTSPRIMLVYFSGVAGDRQFNTMSAIEWTGGYTGLGIQLGDTKLMLTAIGSLPDTQLYLLNTGAFAFATMTNGYQWVNDGGRILTQKEGSDSKWASAVNYVNFVCNDPYRQLKAHSFSTDPQLGA